MNKKTINKIIGVLLVTAVLLVGKMLGLNEENKPQTQELSKTQVKSSPVSYDDGVYKAYQSKKSDVQVKGFGTVIKILRDDTKGHKHQKFILGLKSGISILIAHNIDLAPRIQGIKKGDIIEFYGEYEYNKKGGVVHWTHHDPKHRHADGWLKSKGMVYQ